MINFIMDKELKDNRKILYAIFYLTKNYDAEINISSNHLENSINVYYGIEPKQTGSIYIPYDEICCQKEKKAFYNNYDEKVFMTFQQNINTPFLKKDGNIVFTFDILMLSFYLLSCKEEYEIHKRDSNNRFIGEFSYRKEKLNIPFFDVNALILYDAINNFNKNINLKKRQFEIFLNHDVDNINSRNRYVLLHNFKELILNKRIPFIKRIKNLIYDILFNRHLQIENYMKIEKQKNAKSEFYFIAGVKHRLGKRYELETIKREIDMLVKDTNHDIGIHVNYFSYDDEKMIKQEVDSIEKIADTKIISGKNHWLRFNVPTTWNKLNVSGILCDSTLGYSDINGFRASTTQSFLPYNIDKDDVVPILEVPLVIMDGIIMEEQSSFEDKWCNIKKIIDQVINYSGTVSILWHQRVIYDNEYKLMYEKILDYVNEKGGRFILAKDLISRYEQQKEKLDRIFHEYRNL